MTTLPPPVCWTLTVKQTCALLGISRSKLYYLINAKSRFFAPDFPRPIRLGRGAVRFDRAALMAWYTKQQIESMADIETVSVPPLPQSASKRPRK